MSKAPPDLFVFPNKVLFGRGSIHELESQLSKLNVSRPLFVTDSGLTKNGLASTVHQELKKEGMDGPIFDGSDENPTEENVLEGLEIYEKEKCDGIIGFGGGSSLDAAKGIRVKSTHPLPLAEYAIGAGGWDKLVNPMPPMAAVPTTAGTGSEVGRGALIIVRPSGAKVAIAGENLFPTFSLCDPELTVNLPPFLTAGTGMDALTHCIEEYLSPKYNPLVDGMVLEGIRRGREAIVRAYEDGSDLEARGEMMIAAMIGGIGFSKGLGVVHSLSHPIGSVIGGHHGTINAILLPAALEFNFNHSLDRFLTLADALGVKPLSQSDEASGQAVIAFIRELNQKLKIPEDLSVYGAKRDQIAPMLPMCMADHCHKTNPRPCTEEDFQQLLEAHIPQ